MVYADNSWWILPAQCIAILGAAINLGGSGLQSPLTMPMLQLPSVPVHHTAPQISFLLHRSEFIFPPLNALCTVCNLLLTAVSLTFRKTSLSAAGSLIFRAAALVFSIGTTLYSLRIMRPVNKRMVTLGNHLAVNESDEKAMKELQFIQDKWINLNYVRAGMMFGSALASTLALAADV